MRQRIGAAIGLLMLACGGGVRLSPEMASADHGHPAPENSVSFGAFTACPAFQACTGEATVSSWAVSDPRIAVLDRCDPPGNACTVVCREAGSVTLTVVDVEGATAVAALTCH